MPRSGNRVVAAAAAAAAPPPAPALLFKHEEWKCGHAVKKERRRKEVLNEALNRIKWLV